MNSDEAAPGWREIGHREGFNAIFGKALYRVEVDGRVRCRVETGPQHANPTGLIHGGFLMSFADHASFVGLFVLGRLSGPAVTVGASLSFIGAGRPGLPVDALVEVIGETGRMLFVRGLIEQEGRAIASFELTLRKRSAAPPRA